MIAGTVAGLAAGALWAAGLVGPLMVLPYTALDITVLRYLVFGLSSLLILAALPRHRPRGFTVPEALRVMGLGFVGYAGFSILSSYAVVLAGTAVVAVVVGTLPIVLTIAGNRGREKLPWRALALPISLAGAGLALVNAETLANASLRGAVGEALLGIGLAFACVVSWTWYAIANADALKARPGTSAVAWTTLQGLGAMLGLPILYVIGLLVGQSAIPTHGLGLPQASSLWVWAIFLGVCASWLASWTWSIAAQQLPVSLTAQLLTTEMLFALLYTYAIEGRGPTTAEALGAGLIVTGVIVGIRVFSQK